MDRKLIGSEACGDIKGIADSLGNSGVRDIPKFSADRILRWAGIINILKSVLLRHNP